MTRIFHGQITGDPSRPAKSITSRDLDPAVRLGDLVTRWNHYFIWDEACIPGKELEKIRWTGDDLCDEVVKFLGMEKGDILVKLEAYMAATAREDWDDAIRRFWESVEGRPPNGVNACQGQFCPDFDCKSKSQTLSRGQAVFWKYISPILTSLLHFSIIDIPRPLLTLITGFSAPNIIEVLLHTSYLTSSSSAITNRRLFETAQMVLDAMNDMTPSSGIGFRSVLKVRMLHSHVRLRLLRSPKFDTKYGVPINQEDLLATLGAVSVACIWSMERMGIHIAREDKAAYIAAWKHIGYYMGIHSTHLERFYKDYHAAEKHLCSSIVHLLEPELGKPSGMLPLQLLEHISNLPLYGQSIQFHSELSRRLIGDELADVFRLPRANLMTRMGVLGSLTLMRLEIMVGRWYFSGWERERVRLMKEFVDYVVMWQIGNRQAFERSGFGYKNVVEHDIGKKTRVNRKVNGMSVAGVEKDQVEETDGNVTVHVDGGYIKALKRRYYGVIVFQPVVLVGGIVCAVGWTLVSLGYTLF